jgi:hypothetical protein
MFRQNTVVLRQTNISECTHELLHQNEINELRIEEGSYYNDGIKKFISALADKEGNEFLSVLANKKSVTSLDVDARHASPEFVCELLGQVLMTSASSSDSSPKLIDRLKKFKYLSRNDSKEAFATLCQYLSSSSSLEEVMLYCPIHAEDVATVLGSSTTIKKLNLTLCPLEDAGSKILAKGVLNNKSLTELNVANTGIKGGGSVDIVRAVAAQGMIDSLCLHGITIPTNHLREIVDILIPNTTLKHLDLNYVKIDDEGAKLIAELIMGNQSLRKIELQRCGISSNGLAVIEEALQKNNPCAREVDLRKYEDYRCTGIETYPATLSTSGRSPLESLNLWAKKDNTPKDNTPKDESLAPSSRNWSLWW